MKNKLFEKGLELIDKYSTHLLSGGIIIGTIVTGVLAYKAGKELAQNEEKTKLDYVKAVAPPVISGSATVACVVGLNNIHAKKYAALAGMYALSQTDLRTYKEKVEELFGKEKAKEVDDEIKRNRDARGPIFVDLYREQTFFDRVTGRYFGSTVHKIDEAANKTNALIIREGRACLNDFYKFLDLDEVELGELIRWHQGDVYDVLELRYDTQMTKDYKAVMTIEYNIQDHYSW